VTLAGEYLGEADRGALAKVVEEARSLGYVAGGSADEHMDHALGFGQVLVERLHLPALLATREQRYGDVSTGSSSSFGPANGMLQVLDLGSGAGLPGLVLAKQLPWANVTLLEAQRRRCAFLQEAVVELGLEARATVVNKRAEDYARDTRARSAFDAVTARGFGSPAVTAECAAGFLRLGGLLVVSEPPGARGETRWPPEHLAPLGLEPIVRVTGVRSYQVLRQSTRCGERFPRRTGVPSKRPLYRVG